MFSRKNSVLLMFAVLLPLGCGSEANFDDEALDKMAGGKRQETVAVSGKVTVGGVPTGNIVIYGYTQASGLKPAAETHTKADGTYCWNTYTDCDGVPPGEYKLTFAHIPNERKGKKQGEDLLKGQYKDPAKSEFSLVVTSGAPQADVNYDLK